MEKIDPFSYKLLTTINDSPEGMSLQECVLMHGDHVSEVIEALFVLGFLSQQYEPEDYTRYPEQRGKDYYVGAFIIPTGNIAITNKGKSYLVKHKALYYHSLREKILDGFIGFVFGFACGLLTAWVIFRMRWG